MNNFFYLFTLKFKALSKSKIWNHKLSKLVKRQRFIRLPPEHFFCLLTS
ncbi:AURKAIP1/COX24 domain-containing protein [Pedobacter petrophilus]|uniref:AURKAIP1/COX24 domain-containing protein n=1 Tax=Pedobacter petrophilus TaxID=1908241 RepID=A0A7K0FU75_9SPHI|nr:AURKAIP1/COX24 domain-containing protein [Pedobacter petrophilus]